MYSRHWKKHKARYHMLDQKLHEVLHTIMMKTILMKKVTANHLKKNLHEYILPLRDAQFCLIITLGRNILKCDTVNVQFCAKNQTHGSRVMLNNSNILEILMGLV